MKNSKRFFSLLMTMFMMAMSPANVWADGVTITPLRGYQSIDEEGYANLFDGDNDTKWCSKINEGCYVIFKLSESRVISEYTLVDGGDTDTYTGRHWKKWTIYGANFTSDDDAVEGAAAWVAIDSRSEDKYNYNNQSYTVSNAAYYQYYKIVVEEVGVSSLYDEDWGEMYEEKDLQQMADISFTFAEPAPTGISGVEANPSSEGATIYDVMGRRQQSLVRGVNFIRQADGTVKKVMCK